MKHSRMRAHFAGILVLLFAGVGQVNFAQESHVGGLTGEASRGKQLYRRYCVGCHGPLGDGRGENAPCGGAPH